jgi:uncharacterized protein with GYD domain
MPQYLLEVSYNHEGWAALVRNPQNRLEAIRPSVERLGGKIAHGWFAFGEADVITVIEMPDNVSIAALAMAISAGGAVRTTRTIPLMSVAEGIEALKKAGKSGYKPAAAGA